MQLVILDYGSGNLRSVEQSVRRASHDVSAQLGTPEVEISLCRDAEDVRKADMIILPGVGHYADCWAGLSALDGMLEALGEQVIQKAKPFLGICVGMQLMANRGFEGVETKGLGWINADVKALNGGIDSYGNRLKIPHMGWNSISLHQADHALCHNIQDGDQLYFLHSYHMDLLDKDVCLASAQYGETITAMVARDTMVGTQFHPEKSQRLGQQLLRNFLTWRP